MQRIDERIGACLFPTYGRCKNPGWSNSDSSAKSGSPFITPHFSLPIWKPLDESLEYQQAHVDSNRNCKDTCKYNMWLWASSSSGRQPCPQQGPFCDSMKRVCIAYQVVSSVFDIDTFMLSDAIWICRKA